MLSNDQFRLYKGRNEEEDNQKDNSTLQQRKC